MLELFYQILTSLSVLLIEPSIPKQPTNDWINTTKWTKVGDALSFSSESRTLVEKCKNNPSHFVVFPTVMQGFHEIFLDDKLIRVSGDHTFTTASALYNAVEINCSILAQGSKITWKVMNLTHSYAKVSQWPELQASRSFEISLNTMVQAASGGIIFVVGLLCFITFEALGPRITTYLLFSSFFLGSFFTLSVPESFGIELHPFLLHRLHDLCLWVGMIFIWHLLHILCNVPRYMQVIHAVTTFIAVILIVASKNLDQSQVGSTVAFLGNLLCLIACVPFQFSKIRRIGLNRRSILQILPVTIFCITGINDILLNLDVINGVAIFNVGTVFCFVLVALVANQSITEIHRERDHLRANLEIEVEEKTSSLNQKSNLLEQTIFDLKNAQAEVLQSAKLASLGTLSAGLAHEINNSLNYPRGALPLLRRILQKDTLTPEDKKKANDILELSNEGLTLTSEIIKNLKRYTSGKVGEREPVNVYETVKAVHLLVKGQLQNKINVKIMVPENCEVQCSRVGLSQVLMNLFGNAIDALLEANIPNPEIRVAMTQEGNNLILSVSDNGPGIPLQIRDRVIDPFFTTKPEGKGTGLGLYIVNREMVAVGGKVVVVSEPGQGAEIQLVFTQYQLQEIAA